MASSNQIVTGEVMLKLPYACWTGQLALIGHRLRSITLAGIAHVLPP